MKRLFCLLLALALLACLAACGDAGLEDTGPAGGGGGSAASGSGEASQDQSQIALGWALEQVLDMASKQAQTTGELASLYSSDQELRAMITSTARGVEGQPGEAWLLSGSSQLTEQAQALLAGGQELQTHYRIQSCLNLPSQIAASYGDRMLAASSVLTALTVLSAPAALEDGGMVAVYDSASVAAGWARTPEGLLVLRVTLVGAAVPGETLAGLLPQEPQALDVEALTAQEGQPEFLPAPEAAGSLGELEAQLVPQLLSLLQENCAFQARASTLSASLIASAKALSEELDPAQVVSAQRWGGMSLSQLGLQSLAEEVNSAALEDPQLMALVEKQVLDSLPVMLSAQYGDQATTAVSTLCQVTLYCPAPAGASRELFFITYESGRGVCIQFAPDESGFLTVTATPAPALEDLSEEDLEELLTMYDCQVSSVELSALGL